MIHSETAIVLGLVGSLHCLGMCGPLAVAQPAGRNRIAGRLVYNGGRVITYIALGLLAGAAGHLIRLGALQRGLSITAGILLVGFLIASRLRSGRWNPSIQITQGVGRLRSAMAGLLQRHSLASALGLGLLNGLLPCGLVYVALAAALATGSIAGGALYMGLFGLGTVPAMVTTGLAGLKIQRLVTFRPRLLIPLAGFTVASLLILRGLNLGIPYVSPAYGEETAAPSCCPVADEAISPATPSCCPVADETPAEEAQ